jgi:hypothetical protein
MSIAKSGPSLNRDFHFLGPSPFEHGDYKRELSDLLDFYNLDNLELYSNEQLVVPRLLGGTNPERCTVFSRFHASGSAPPPQFCSSFASA